MKTIILEVEDHIDISQVLNLLESYNIKAKVEKKLALSEKLALLEKSKGTINVPWNLSDDDFDRENLYENRGL